MLLVVVLLAALLRFSHLGYASFTHTESWRANWTHTGGLDQARRFPPLQFLLCRSIQRVFGRHEAPLRWPYAVAGVGCVVAVYGFARKLAGERAALLASALAMAHPVLVHYSRRQLEYSFEACAAAAVLWAGLAAYRRPSPKTAWVFLLVALIGLGFAFTAILLVFAWLPLLLWQPLGSSIRERRSCWQIWFVTSVIVVSAGASYMWLSGAPCREMMVKYYLDGESVWPPSYEWSRFANWLAVSGFGVVHYVLGMSDTWLPLNWVLGTLYVFSGIAALGVLWVRNRSFYLFLSILWIEAVLCGALKLWPFGDIRHSTYLIPVAMVVVATGMGELIRRLRWSAASAFLLLVGIAVPAMRAARVTVWAPRADEHIRPVFEHVADHLQPGDGVFLYYFSRDAYEFYEPRWDIPVLLQPDSDRGDLDAFSTRFRNFAIQYVRVWFVFSHDWKDERRDWLRYLKSHYDLLDQVEYADASGHLFQVSFVAALP